MRSAALLGLLVAMAAAGRAQADPLGRAQADPLKIFAAGSLSGVIGELVTASGIPAASVASPVFGPAGWLADRLAGGEIADVFASADMHQPERIAAERPAVNVVPFARNRMCAIGAKSLGMNPSTVLDRMLDPALRLATSTPGADPGGDYALAVFARAEAVHRGAQATLRAKAQALYGGPNTMVPTNGHTPGGTVLLGKRADIVLYYCSGAAAVVREVPDSVSVPVPAALEPVPVYGMAVLSPNPDASRFALFTLSPRGQAILARHGLLPVLSGSTGGVSIMTPSHQPAIISLSELRTLPSLTATVNADAGSQAHYGGPTLWSVLQQAGAIDPNFHNRVNQQVIVTGQDGYSVTVGMGEIDPEFENKQVILATERDGGAVDAPRLAVPGDKRAGRSVRDVASIVVR
jgi:molybdate transport system substrate-binding protein